MAAAKKDHFIIVLNLFYEYNIYPFGESYSPPVRESHRFAQI